MIAFRTNMLMSSALALTLALSPVQAQAGADVAGAGEAPGDSIIVIGRADGYVAIQTVTATKTDTPLIDVPQSIQVVTRDKLDDQASYSIADVLRYVPGTTVGQGEGNRDQITLRGQNTTADFFLDGVRDDVQYYRGLYNIERVEVLKGPYALIFGRGGGGGIINRVQKAPVADSLFVAGRGSVNTFGAWDVAADINMPLNGFAAFRLNATYEELDNHRDYYGGERFAVNPYLGVKLGERWTLGLSYEYVNDDRVTDRGVPSVQCVGCVRGPLLGHRDTFFGVPNINRFGLQAHIVKARLDGELADGLNWSSTVLYGDYDKYYTNIFPNSFVRLSDNTLELDGYTDATGRKNFLAQSNLVWDLDLGKIGNKFLLGVEYGNQDTDNSRNVSATKPRVSVNSLANGVFPAFAVPFSSLSRSTTSNVTTFSAYVQNQISIGEHVDLVAGIRYDRFEIDGVNRRTGTAFGRTDEKVSPRVGLILKPRNNISIYGSYSQSFLPRSGDQFISLDTTTQNLAPEKFTNYEVGAKWDILPRLNATVALFQLDRTNATTPNPSAPSTNIVTGKTRTRGVELALIGRILHHWQMSGGYTYQKAHLTDNENIRLPQVPSHQFALWNRYDFNPAVGAGIGVVHQSSQFAAIDNATRLPGFTRVDAALFFKANEKLEFQVNVENLFDTDYFADAHNNNNITPGAPINTRFTARFKF